MELPEEIPVLAKSKVLVASKEHSEVSSCCTPKSGGSICCTPSVTPEDHAGACCAQPADGTACCDK